MSITSVMHHLDSEDTFKLRRGLACETMHLGEVTIFVNDDLPSETLGSLADSLTEMAELVNARIAARTQPLPPVLTEWDVTIRMTDGERTTLIIEAIDDFEAEAVAQAMFAEYTVRSVTAVELDRALLSA